MIADADLVLDKIKVAVNPLSEESTKCFLTTDILLWHRRTYEKPLDAMKLFIYDRFWDAFLRLNKTTQTKVTDFIGKFRSNQNLLL